MAINKMGQLNNNPNEGIMQLNYDIIMWGRFPRHGSIFQGQLKMKTFYINPA